MSPCPVSRPHLGFVIFLLLLLVGACVVIWSPLCELVRVHASMIFSGGFRYASADARAQWAAAHPDVLRLAMLGNWSSVADCGPARKAAFERAIAEVNAAGGVKGRRLVPEWIEIGGSGDRLQVTLTRLVSDPSSFVAFTGLKSDPLLASRSLLLRGRLLTFAPGVSNQRLTRSGEIPYVFLPNPSDGDVSADLVERLGVETGFRLLACQDASDETGCLASDVQITLQRKVAGEFWRVRYLDVGTWGFIRSEMIRFRDVNGVRSVLLLNDERDDGAYRDMLRWLLKMFPGQIGVAHAIEGDWSAEEAKRLVVAKRPTAAEASARAIHLFADAANRAKRLHPEDIIEILRTTELKTPTGPFRFTPLRFEQKR